MSQKATSYKKNIQIYREKSQLVEERNRKGKPTM
jgi:hypothetical protein